MYASYLGHKEMSQLLLAKRANPETENKNGQTAIMMAASCGSVDVVGFFNGVARNFSVGALLLGFKRKL